MGSSSSSHLGSEHELAPPQLALRAAYLMDLEDGSEQLSDTETQTQSNGNFLHHRPTHITELPIMEEIDEDEEHEVETLLDKRITPSGRVKSSQIGKL